MSKPVDTVIIKSVWPSATTSVFAALEGFDATSDAIQVERAAGNSIGRASSVESAVFAHIRAMRALGRVTANTAQIARALSVTTREVDQAVSRLHDRGVKLVSR